MTCRLTSVITKLHNATAEKKIKNIKFAFCFTDYSYHGSICKKKENTHDMSINKLLQFSISNYGLLLYFSFIWTWNC